MQFYKTVDDGDLIRIEDDEGSAVTVLKKANYARILSLIVQKGDRREGMGTALIEAAAGLLWQKGIKKLEVDYSDAIEGFGEFLREAGFLETVSSPVLSVELKKLLSQAAVKRAVLSEVEGANYVSLADLDPDQWEDLFGHFKRLRLTIENADMARFSYDASGVVYDDGGSLQAFLLSTTDEDESVVHVDFLVGVGKARPQYIMCALSGMLKGLIKAGGDESYKRITMVAANPAVNAILDRILKNSGALMDIGNAVLAIKELEEIHNETQIEDMPDEDMEDEWKREIRKIPFQANIGLKMPWLRHKDDPKAEEEVPKEEDSEDIEEEIEEDIEEEQEDDKERGVLDELLLLKDVDETEGLAYDDTVRITPGNLGHIREFLDDVSVSDMSRHFFRGLIALKEDAPATVLVYELKNFEERSDTEAEVTYLSIKDEEAGKRLLAEFISEVNKDSVKRTYFELEELSGLEETLLKDAGFSIEKREGCDIVLTLSELGDISVLSKKPKKYVKSIRSLSKKQFMRGINSCLFANRKGILEDLGILPAGWFERDISSCVVSDARVTGLFLIHLRGDDSLSLDLLYAAGAEYRSDLLYMLRYSLAAAAKKYPAETKVVIKRHNKEVMMLTDRLFAGRPGRMVFAGERR